MVINLVALWLAQILLAYLLSRLFGLGADGIWLALGIGWFAQAVLMWCGAIVKGIGNGGEYKVVADIPFL